MFHKVLSMLLCVCMLTGSVPNTAYAMEPTVVKQTGSVEETTSYENDVMESFSEETDNYQLTVKGIIPYATDVDAEINITGPEELSGFVIMYYRKSDSEEWQRSSQSEQILHTGDQVVRFSDFEENTFYQYIIGIGDVCNTAVENLISAKEGSFSTVTDDSTLSVTDIKSGIHSLEFKTQLYGNAAGGGSCILLYYRKAESGEEWKYFPDYTDGATTIITLSHLEEDTEYEYVIGIGKDAGTGIDDLRCKLTGTGKTLPDDRSISVNVLPTESGAEMMVTLSGEGANGQTYIVYGWKEKGTQEESTSFEVMYFPTSITINTWNGQVFKPDTAYTYWIGIGKDANTPKEEVKGLITGEFTTLEDNRDIVVTFDPQFKRIIADFEVTGQSEGKESIVQIYYRKAGSSDEWETITTSVGNGLHVQSLHDLEPDTEYEIVVGIAANWNIDIEALRHKKTAYMKTIADDRNVTASVSPTSEGVKIDVTLTGEAAVSDLTRVAYYWREKGTLEENKGTIDFYYHLTQRRLLGAEEGIKENTTYEYWIGIEEDASTGKEGLRNLIMGEVTTFEEENIRLESVTCEPGYTSVKMTSFVTMNTELKDIYLTFFYRKVGEQTWESMGFHGAGYESRWDTFPFDGLESGATYEYIVTLNTKDHSWSPEEITKETCRKSGTFTTKKSEYTATITPDSNNITAQKAVLKVAVDKGTDEVLYVALTLSNGQKAETTLMRKSNYEGNVTFTNLVGGTEYAVSEAILYVYENGTKMEICRLPQTITFTTKEGKIPTKISLSKDKLTLNAGSAVDYIGRFPLKVTFTPQDAEKGLIWESSAVEVATVNGGNVQAVGEGTAIITVKSSVNQEIMATCEVTVKNYVVGKSTEAGIQMIPEADILYLNKGDSFEGLGLYEKINDSWTLVEDFHISVEKNNIVKWDAQAGVIIGQNPGTTKLYLEKNGVKALANIQVSHKEYSFALTGTKAGDSSYPANILDKNTYELALKENLKYIVEGKLAPNRTFDTKEYSWTSSDETVAVVKDGIITPLKAGTAVITATPKESVIKGTSSITVKVKEIPGILVENPTVYVLTSQLSKKSQLKEVPLPKEMGEGWKWCEPETVIYNLPLHDEAYEFEACYTGSDKYPIEKSIKVYLGTIKNHVIEKVGSHLDVLEVAQPDDLQKDQLTFKIGAEKTGNISPQIQWKLAETIEGLSITEKDGLYTVSASKAGEYDLKPYAQYVETDETGNVVKKETVYTGSYKITAVDNPQAAQMELTTNTEGIQMDEKTGMLSFEFTSEMKGKKIDLKTVVKDRKGQELEVPVIWKITDNTVATIAPSRGDSHTAVLTVKGEGNAVLTVQAKDTGAYTQELNLEFRNYIPRVNGAKTKVNLALNYDEWYGQEIAYKLYKGIDIAEAYGNNIQDIKLLKQDETIETNFDFLPYNYQDKYIVKPTKLDIATGTYKYTMVIETKKGTYKYPMTITVENKQPSVKAKVTSKVNLFYKTLLGRMSVSIPNSYRIEKVEWKDTSDSKGFELKNLDGAYSSKNQYLYYLNIAHENVEIKDRKPIDPKIAKGTLYVKVKGLLEPVEIKNFSIGYQYKVPKLKAINATGNIVPKLGVYSTNFRVYDTQMKQDLYYSDSPTDSHYYNCNAYNYLTDDNDNVTSSGRGNFIYVNGDGKQKKETVNFILDSLNWREPLTVKYTIKSIEPKAYLHDATLIYNKANRSISSTYIGLKDSNFAEFMDIEYTASNDKAKDLTDKDVFNISHFESNTVAITLNSAEILGMEEELKTGTYSYKLTPYYKDAETGEKTALNTLTLKLKVIDKPVTAKVTLKGTLDLVDKYHYESNGNYSDVYFTRKFNNLPSGYNLISSKLKGEYSEYFKLYNNYYLNISKEGEGKLKAGHIYPLTVEYTFNNGMGDTLVVESNVIKVKPKQSTPKVTIENNNQILFASNKDIIRTYSLNSSYFYYQIQDVTGSLDVNKDDKPDLLAELSWRSNSYAEIAVRLINADAVIASTKGKAYTIPLNITFEGRDGISKDVTTNIKVTVKR